MTVAPSPSKAVMLGAMTAEVVGEISANSGRWVKLTKESAEAVKKTSTAGQQVFGVIRDSGKIQRILKFENATLLATPAAAPALAATLAQMAIEHTLAEISEQLEGINESLHALIQDQKDKALSDLLGLSRITDDVMRIKNHTGFVSDVDWQKVAFGYSITAAAQSYALRKLNQLSGKLADERSAKAIKIAGQDLNKEITDWLSVLAFSLQVEDKLALIEIDRVLSTNPNFSENHIQALKENRRSNLTSITASLSGISSHIDQARMSAASHKLFHPRETDRAIFELNTSAHNLHELSENIGLALEHQTPFVPPKWRTTVDESVEAVKGSVKAIGASVEEHSERIVDHAKALPGKLPEIKAPRLNFGRTSSKDEFEPGAGNPSWRPSQR